MVDEVRARALDLAARVARVQTRAKISTLEVARLCGVPSSSLSKLLKGVVADTPAGRANLDSLATWLSRSHDQWVARVAEQGTHSAAASAYASAFAFMRACPSRSSRARA
jgi:transcriptional regulator with XRE-family HTH domain